MEPANVYNNSNCNTVGQYPHKTTITTTNFRFKVVARTKHRQVSNEQRLNTNKSNIALNIVSVFSSFDKSILISFTCSLNVSNES